MKDKGFSINLKFSFAVGIILLIFCAFMSVILYYYLRSQVVKDAEDKTAIIMAHVKATGDYVREALRPAIFDALDRLNAQDEFIIEAMSTTHVSMQVMSRFNKDQKDYVFKRLSDNPMNKKNSADLFHLEMLSYFRSNPDHKAWKGIVTLDAGQYLYRLNPVMMDATCLQCHGSPFEAPVQLVRIYGNSSGFNWKVGEVIGVNSVSVPLDAAFAEAKKSAIDVFLYSFVSLFVLFIALCITFRQIVTKPIDNLSKIFRGIAQGKEPLGKEIPIDRRDEIGGLTESFNTLTRHLLEAQERLKKTAEIEKQMMETEKLAVIGQLSAGVAHEINNPLGGMKLCFNNLLNTKMDADAQKEHIEVINSGFGRIQNIVKQLLDFSKNTPLNLEKTSVNRVIENVLILSEYTISKKGIKIVRDFIDYIPEMLLDSNKLEQVFLNLILNAAQAMDEKGILGIKTFKDDDFCYVSVSDTGRGIPEDILPKIFSPFFTTKAIGEGTGLGLTVSKAIVEQHKGELIVETSEAGSTFTVKLPLIL
jgi:signal transduction histidine kinase